MAILLFSAVHIDTKWKGLDSELLQGVNKKKREKWLKKPQRSKVG